MVAMGQGLDILVAEENEPVREMLAHVLTMLGHRPACTGSGMAALDLVTRRRFDLLITGLALPDMIGLDLCESAQDLAPGLAVLVTCGGEGVSLEPGRVPRLLRKPFTLDSLRRELEKVVPRDRERHCATGKIISLRP